jgi:hypothetical protein
MTGMIDSAHPIPGGAGRRGPNQFGEVSEDAALLEQAKGVLIFRYAIDADAAYSLLELWAAETGTTSRAVAHAVVHEICQGNSTGADDPQLVRWLEDRLRHEFPGAECDGGGEPSPVTVAVDSSDSSLEQVVDAAREAARRGVALEVTTERVHRDEPHDERAHLMQRLDLAVGLARAVAPHVDVRLPRDNPFEPGAGD